MPAELTAQKIADLREETGMSLFEVRELQRAQEAFETFSKAREGTLEEQVAYLMSQAGRRAATDLDRIEARVPAAYRLDREAQDDAPDPVSP